MTIDRMLSIFATIVSVVAVPASGYLSYYFAIKGEKRKEWNALAEPVLESLEEIHHFWKLERDVHINHIPSGNIEKLRRRMKGRERGKFDVLWEGLQASVKEIKQSPAPLLFSRDGSHKEAWVSPYPDAVKVINALLGALSLR